MVLLYVPCDGYVAVLMWCVNYVLPRAISVQMTDVTHSWRGRRNAIDSAHCLTFRPTPDPFSYELRHVCIATITIVNNTEGFNSNPNYTGTIIRELELSTALVSQILHMYVPVAAGPYSRIKSYSPLLLPCKDAVCSPVAGKIQSIGTMTSEGGV